MERLVITSYSPKLALFIFMGLYEIELCRPAASDSIPLLSQTLAPWLTLNFGYYGLS